MLMRPILNLTYSTESIPILFAFILGIVGALAPCQFTGNIGAITLYGNKSVQKGLAWADVFLFTLGKIVVFSGIGLLVWSFGNEFEGKLTIIFPWIRNLIGPILILVGSFLMGFIKIKRNFFFFKYNQKGGKWGSFFMGISFSLGFCPTMFVLFFVTLMPVVLSTSYGFVLPSIFALGTTLPLFVALLLIWYYGAGGVILKKGRKIGSIIQRVAGIILILLGIFDTLTYWTI